jgi:hypothetical protein
MCSSWKSGLGPEADAQYRWVRPDAPNAVGRTLNEHEQNMEL